MAFADLLGLLADGKFHSGDELGALLGVSRAAVWKQVKKIDELGIELESVKGKGYRIQGGLDLLDGARLRQGLQEDVASLLNLDIRQVLVSTNDEAMSQVTKLGGGYVCAAEMQTGGKGRRGKSWVSPFGSNLYFSLVWEFGGGAAALEGLSLAVGVAIAEALRLSGVGGVELKWPNDVLFQGKKLAGVLLEMSGDAAGPCQVVTGIGLNVCMPPRADSGIDQPWTDVVAINEHAAHRNELLAAILNQLVPMLLKFEQSGFEVWQQRWNALNAHAGCEVVLTLGDQLLFGVDQGVTETGAICLQTDQGLKAFSGGEISLRVGEA